VAREQPEKIAIIGLGLIGGSIGLGLKAAKLEGVQVVGHDRDPSVGAKARRVGAVDESDWNLISAVRGANMVIIATPVVGVRETFGFIADHLEPGCVITDTASTKAEVMGWAADMLPPNIHFVGGHAMAGKETPGIDGAEATLFKGATYCVFPTATAHPDAVRAVIGLAELLGATPYFLDPNEHDGFVGGISHLPLILSSALVSATAGRPTWRVSP